MFQPAGRAYTFATDDCLLKWKWPDMTSVDLRVELRADADGEERVASLNALGPGERGHTVAYALMCNVWCLSWLLCAGGGGGVVCVVVC